MSDRDAAKVGDRDNDWIEAVNRNGVVVARAIVSHRMPEGTVYMHHAQDRLIDVPRAETSGKRGGIHNSLTRLFLKPSHLIGGYAQLSFAFNYLGPTGNQRDEVTVIRTPRTAQELRVLDEGHGTDGHGHEPRQVHRLPHLLGHLQAGVDQPDRHRVRLVQQRRDPARAGLPAHLRRPGDAGRAAGRSTGAGGSPCEPAAGCASSSRSSPTRRCRRSTTTTSPGPTTTRRCTNAPLQEHTPVARPKSLISGDDMKIRVERNWDDNLGGRPELAQRDPCCCDGQSPTRSGSSSSRPSCSTCRGSASTASTLVRRVVPQSGAIYKRAEDGIVLVDQDRCRGWRMCVTGCPYKKIYFNHRTGKAEKCTFCFPRVEVGIPTVCSETCVGRLRYIGLVLYDADRVLAAASTKDDTDLYRAQRAVFLDPHDPEVIRAAEQAGIPRDWVDAAQRSPVWALINRFEVALPLHPEYRTMPMVWYIPPLSPVVDVVRETGEDAEAAGNLFGAIDALRIPVEYLAELFTAGDPAPVNAVLRGSRRCARTCATSTWAANRTTPSRRRSGWTARPSTTCTGCWRSPSTTSATSSPPRTPSRRTRLEELATECSLDYEGGPGMGGSGPFGESSGGVTPLAVENFHMLKQRQTADEVTPPRGRVNLLNWDAKGGPRACSRQAAGATGGGPSLAIGRPDGRGRLR